MQIATMPRTCRWLDFEFQVLDPASNWNDVPGIYIFATVTYGKWRPLYIGQADSFKNRFANHERWDEARRYGASHVHVIVEVWKDSRDQIERRLIQAFIPALNVQHCR